MESSQRYPGVSSCSGLWSCSSLLGTVRAVFGRALLAIVNDVSPGLKRFLLALERIYLPQPNSGVPGLCDLTLTFLGEAGVAGRLDIVKKAQRSTLSAQGCRASVVRIAVLQGVTSLLVGP